MTDRPLSPADQIRRIYEETEKRTATHMEDLVSSQGFSEMLAQVVGNAMAVTKFSSTILDDLVRRSHLAGRTDLARVGRQIGRTEDKLEQVLQLVERLQDDVAQLRAEVAAAAPAATAPSAAAPAAPTSPSATLDLQAAPEAAGDAPSEAPSRPHRRTAAAPARRRAPRTTPRGAPGRGEPA